MSRTPLAVQIDLYYGGPCPQGLDPGAVQIQIGLSTQISLSCRQGTERADRLLKHKLPLISDAMAGTGDVTAVAGQLLTSGRNNHVHCLHQLV